MNEKLRIEIDYILAEVANHSNRYSDEDDAFRAIEQAFRDNGWIKASELTRKEFLGLSLEKRREILGREVKALESKPSPPRFASNSCEAMGMD